MTRDEIQKKVSKQENLEQRLKNQFEKSGQHETGELEQMKERIYTLENAVAHLMAFIANRLRLTPDEIENENGLTDF